MQPQFGTLRLSTSSTVSQNWARKPFRAHARGGSCAGPSHRARKDVRNSPAIDGVLPGVTAGIIAGPLGGCLAHANPGAAVSWAIVGMIIGMITGCVLGGIAGVYYHRRLGHELSERWRASMLLGAAVGLATCSVFGNWTIVPWGVVAGLAAAAIWPLLGRLTREPERAVLVGAHDDRTQAPAEYTRHFVDPSELDYREHFVKRRNGQYGVVSASGSSNGTNPILLSTGFSRSRRATAS